MLRSSFIREVTLYRYRYTISYGLFTFLLFGLLLFGISQIPRGLAESEMQSAVNSVNINILNPQASNVIDAPYHLFQKASIQLFGLNLFAIKLPSIVFGVFTGLALIIMLQRWFKRNVAVITAIIISTSVGFLSMSRLGEPLIMPTFWTVILLLASTFVLHGHKNAFLWKTICFASVGMLLYSPLGIYPLIAMSIAGIFHPHVRHRLKSGRWWQFILLILAFAMVVTPLTIAIMRDPSVGLRLLGAGDLTISFDRFIDAARTVWVSLFHFTDNEIDKLTLPLFSMTTAALLLLGFLKLCTATYSARSYMLLVWIILLIPVLLFNPSAVLMVLAPAALILAIGVETLIREWYGLFPRNPYARIGALIPLVMLIGSIVMIDVERYYYGNHYSSSASRVFHDELPAIRKTLARKDINQTGLQLVVPAQQTAFYDILRREHKQLVIGTEAHALAKGTLLVTASSPSQPPGLIPYRIVTNDLRENTVLLRVYTQW